MGDHRLMDMDHPFRQAGCPRGEVQQRHVLGCRGMGGKAVGRCCHCRAKRHTAFGRCIAQDQHQLQPGHVGPPPGHLAAILRLGRDQNGGPADFHPRPHRSGTKGGEKGADDHACLQGTQGCRIKVGHAARKQEHPLARADTVGAQHMGETRGPPGKIGIAQHLPFTRASQPYQGRLRAVTCRNMSVQRLMRHVQATARQALDPRPGRCPAGGKGRCIARRPGSGNDCVCHGPVHKFRSAAPRVSSPLDRPPRAPQHRHAYDSGAAVSLIHVKECGACRRRWCPDGIRPHPDSQTRACPA